MLHSNHLPINCFRAKEQVKERIQALSASLNPNPSAPSEDLADGQIQNGHLATDEELEACYLTDQEGTAWEDVKELLVLEHSMKQFIYLLVLRVTTGHRIVREKEFFMVREKSRNFILSQEKCT